MKGKMIQRLNKPTRLWIMSLLLIVFLLVTRAVAQEPITPPSDALFEMPEPYSFFAHQPWILPILGAVIVLLSLIVCGLLWCLRLRRKMEHALLESEERHRLLFDNASLGIGCYTPQGRLIAFNKVAAANMGGEPDDYVGQTLIDLFGVEAGTLYQKRFKTVLESDSRQVYEDLVPLPKGNRWFLSTYSRIMDASGQVVGVQIISNDITERKQIQVAWRESESRFRRAMENIPDVVMIYDQDLRIQYINAATRQITGRPISDFVGRREEEIWPPEVYEKYLPTLQEAFETKTNRSVEVDLDLREDDLRSLIITCVPLLDEDGDVREIMGITHDITKRKRDGQALKESEERLRLFIEHAPASLAMFDHTMCYLAVSQRWITDYHLEAQDIIGRSHYEIFPEIPDRWKEVHRRGLAGEALEANEDVFVRMDDTVQQLHWKVRPWYTGAGDIGGIVIFTEDITQIKRAEEALRESQRTLSTLMSNLPGMAYRCRNDRRWTMLLVSEGATALTGYEPDDLIEDGHIAYADLIHPDDAEKVWGDIQAVVPEDGAFQLTYRIIARDGIEKWVWEQGRGVRLSDGNLVLEGFIIDITARHTAEAAEREQRELAQALSKIALALSRHLDLETLGEVILDQVQRVVEYNLAALFQVDDNMLRPLRLRNFPSEEVRRLRDGVPVAQNGLTFQAISKRQPIFITWTPEQTDIPGLPNLPGPHSRIVVPLIGQDQVIGVLNLIHQTPGYFNAEIAAKLSVFAHHVTVAFQKAELFQQHRHLTQKLVLAQEEERRRVAHELHDDVGQSLTALRMSLQLFRHELTDDSAKAKLGSIIDLAQTTAEQIRRVSYGLHPPMLDTLGLNLAIAGLCEDFAEHTELPIVYIGQEVPGLTETAQISLYRILQESLTNMVRHAQATQVTVELSDHETEVILEINDNGQGFDLAQTTARVGRTGLGLLGMRERAELLGGRFDIQSEPGQGTHIRVVVPRGEIS